MTDIARLARDFRRLHERGCFVIPNAWDPGSAVLLAQLGFPAIATTSSGFAWSVARRDNHVSLDQALECLRAVSAAVDLPVSGDFEGGFAIEPHDVAANFARAALTGVSGLSIEDSTGDAAHPLFDRELAMERVRAARRALDASGRDVVLTGRSEGFIVGRPDLDETIRRLTAYAEAGADCLFAPGVRDMAAVRAIVAALAPKPVNVLVGGGWTTVHALADAGVRRISLGGALARAAWGGFLAAAREIARDGTFAGLASAAPWDEMERAFAETE